MTAMISDSSAEGRGKTTPPEQPACEEIEAGRDAERKILHDLLRRARRGSGGVVLVEGEPGIGKSLLLREATQEAAGQGFSLTAGASDQLGRAIPFFALRTALREPFARSTADNPDRDRPDAPAWWIGQIQAHLEQRAAAVPVLVCLDDLHWASPATLAALRVLPRELKRHPVAWILAGTSTPQQDVQYLSGLPEKDGAAQVTLAPLADDAVARLLTDAFGAPPGPCLLALACGAAGNPSLLTELIHGLRDDNAVHVTDDRAMLASAHLPQRIHRVAQHRLDGLSKQARHLLVTAAVLGPSFRLEDAAEMLGETPATLLPISSATEQVVRRTPASLRSSPGGSMTGHIIPVGSAFTGAAAVASLDAGAIRGFHELMHSSLLAELVDGHRFADQREQESKARAETVEGEAP